MRNQSTNEGSKHTSRESNTASNAPTYFTYWYHLLATKNLVLLSSLPQSLGKREKMDKEKGVNGAE